MWYVKKWNELTPDEIWQILDLRISTFVVEQKRIYHEIDKTDLSALHVFAIENDKIVAYARVFLDGKHVSFGRVVTSEAVRGQGYGMKLLKKIMIAIKENFPGREIEIESQEQVQDFYKKVGFKTIGAPFIFESTPHIKMIHESL